MADKECASATRKQSFGFALRENNPLALRLTIVLASLVTP
jgi:hypothetical protein